MHDLYNLQEIRKQTLIDQLATTHFPSFFLTNNGKTHSTVNPKLKTKTLAQLIEEKNQTPIMKVAAISAYLVFEGIQSELVTLDKAREYVHKFTQTRLPRQEGGCLACHACYLNM